MQIIYYQRITSVQLSFKGKFPYWRIRLLILTSFFSLSLFPEKSLNQLVFMFSFGMLRLTGGSFVWTFLGWELEKSLGAGLSEGHNGLHFLSFSSLLERWKVNKRGSLLIMDSWGEFVSTSSWRWDQRELSLPYFSREGRKKSDGNLLDSMMRAAAVLNLLSLIFFFSILLIGIILLAW